MQQRSIDEVYVPEDERSLRRVQRGSEELEAAVRAWGRAAMRVLPRGLPLIPEEGQIVELFLSQQRRLNMEIDAEVPEETLRTKLNRLLPFIGDGRPQTDLLRAIHRNVASHLESDIDRRCSTFCDTRGIPPISDPVIDWRVAMRFMAQGIQRIACQIDLRREYSSSPKRFELALFAREAATDVVSRRRAMFAAFQKEAV